ncbi:glycoside hydrolase family 65 protein [Ramlibacter sp. AN1015]|uniref:glycoside hydrolase family 65 protein n=1 Tax=Ramlibacter sp. AN1015 TaxID=3133428 RepID=UPI0030BBD737
MSLHATEAPPGDDPWSLTYCRFDPADEGRRESLFALGNGVHVTRAATVHAGPEGPHYPGTYRAGCWGRTGATIEGEHDETDTLVNLPNWLRLDLRLHGEADWLRLDTARLLQYEHRLDLRGGCSWRMFVCADSEGRRLRVTEHRLVSMARPQLAALRLEVSALDEGLGPVALRAWLDGRVANRNVARYEGYSAHHLHDLRTACAAPGEAWLQARIAATGARLALVQRLCVEGARAAPEPWLEGADRCGHAVEVMLACGATAAIEKTVALCTTGSQEAQDDPLRSAADVLAQAPGFDALLQEHRACWAELWERIGLALDDPACGQPAHLHAFHLVQTASPHVTTLDAGVPARGWHGEAYHGHVFWDEAFVLPFFHGRMPEVSRACLLYRWRRLDVARARARQEGLRGAMFPWRSAASGEEVTPRFQKNQLNGAWMRDHTHLQRHIGAAIAWNVWQYVQASGDLEFLADHGAEMVLEIARFWGSLAQPTGPEGRYEIRGVIGPDEYHNAYPGRDAPGLDNNAYTNVMAVWTLCCAREVLEALPPERCEALRRRLALHDDELALWDRISRRMVVPFLADGVIAQFDGFDRLAPFDAQMLPPAVRGERLDWALHAIGRSADEFQITKQADALTLFHLLSEEVVFAMLKRLGYSFDREALLRTARYYMDRSTHRSSLSRVVYAGALARAAPQQSWDLFRQALHTDLQVLEGESVAEGIHLAAMGGTLDTLQRHYLGLGAAPEGLRVEPALPPQLGPVRLSLWLRGQRLHVAAVGDGPFDIQADRANRDTVVLLHRGERIALRPGATWRRPVG